MFKQKEEQIRKYYFSQVKVYLENVKIYHEKRKDIDVQFDADLKELEFEKMFTGKPLMIEKEPKYPKAPVLLLYSNQHILKKQVLQLISNQSQANNTNLKPKTRQSIQMNLKPTSTLQIFDAIGRRHYSLYYIKE